MFWRLLWPHNNIWWQSFKAAFKNLNRSFEIKENNGIWYSPSCITIFFFFFFPNCCLMVWSVKYQKMVKNVHHCCLSSILKLPVLYDRLIFSILEVKKMQQSLSTEKLELCFVWNSKAWKINDCQNSNSGIFLLIMSSVYEALYQPKQNSLQAKIIVWSK